MRIAIGFIFSMVFLSGCASFGEASAPVVVTVAQTRTVYPKPIPIQLSSIDWKVFSSEHPKTYNEYFVNEDSAFCLGPRHYGFLGLNMQEIMRYIQEQKALIDVYERERTEDNERAKALVPEGT